MARPIKTGLDYFPMDTIFDSKIKKIETVFGNDGFVWIVKFWQEAYQTDNGEISLQGYHGVYLAGNSRVTPEKQTEILNLCLEIGLLQKCQSGNYTSNGIQKRISYVNRERERWRNKDQKEVIPTDNPRDNPGRSTQSKVKERKVKEKEIKIPQILQDKDFLDLWKKWKQHRIEIKKPLKPTTESEQINKLENMGCIRAVEALRNSIAGGYQGIFEPNKQNGKKGKNLVDWREYLSANKI